MKSFGLDDVVVRWIEAYLSCRVSREHVGGEHSGELPMHSDLSQGSVIGPLLLLLFVNDLPDVLETLTFDLHQLIHNFKFHALLQRFVSCTADYVFQLVKPPVNYRSAKRRF